MINILYRLIKTERARKTGEGSITYAVLKDAGSQGVYFTLLANDNGGQFSQEIVPFAKIQQCLDKVDAKKPLAAKIPAKTFAPAFVGRSSNNPGFLLAALRQEGLLAPTTDASHLHAITGDWEAWKQLVLKQAGEPYKPPAPKGKTAPVSAASAQKNPDADADVDSDADAADAARDEAMPEPQPPSTKGKKVRKLQRFEATTAEPVSASADETPAGMEGVDHDDAA